MKDNFVIEGERIYLRRVAIEDANVSYCRWMNDPEVTRYLESRFYPQSIEDIRSYVDEISKNADSLFLAIVLRQNNSHIGNIKIHRIDKNHKHAEIALIIGEKTCWGKGLGTEAIRLLVNYAFQALKLHKVYAGCYAGNTGSIKAFKKAGFKEDGVMKQHYCCEGSYIDGIQLAIINDRDKGE